MEKEEILNWNRKYDEDHPWWTQKEKELGDKLRMSKELTKDNLIEVVEWKFKNLVGRKKRILGLIARNDDFYRPINEVQLAFATRRQSTALPGCFKSRN